MYISYLPFYSSCMVHECSLHFPWRPETIIEICCSVGNISNLAHEIRSMDKQNLTKASQTRK